MKYSGGASLRTVVVPFTIFTAIWGSTWIVIRDQLADAPPQWSVAYRFAIAAVVMAIFAKLQKRSLALDFEGMIAAAIIGITQFCINFNSVYLAERHLTSGVVATIFALLIIPNTLLGWAILGQRPRREFAIGSAVAIAGIALLCVNELRQSGARRPDILVGIGFTALGLAGASWANVFQALERVRRHHLKPLLAWAMGIGASLDAILAWAVSGPPVFSTRPGYWLGVGYLAIAASALAFALYFPVVRKIGPGRAAYSSVLVPIIAMGFSTWLEGYRWIPLTVAGALLTLAGMLIALRRTRTPIDSPDAA